MRVSKPFRAALMAGVFLAPTPVLAMQDATPAGEQAATVGDVVVTARRREERLQDVPVAVTALSGEQLAREGVNNVDDLTTKVPNLISVPGTGGGGRAFPAFGIRGQSQQESVILNDSSVGVYFGDIVAARPQGVNQSLIDIQAVEVLKGPQGTLFGRNSTGGAIVIRPNQPSRNYEASVGATVGNLDTRNVEAMVNLPLGDRVQLRVAAGANTDDGFLYDEILKRNINYTDTWSARVTLGIDVSADIRTVFSYNRFSENDGGSGGFLNTVNPNGVFNGDAARAARNYGKTLEQMLAEQQARGIYRTASGMPMFTKVDTEDFANTTTWNLNDDIQIKNIIGYRTVDSHILEDADGMEIPMLPIERIDSFKQFTEEFQILGQTGNLNWIAGLYYFREKGEDEGISVSGGVDPGLLEPDTVYGFTGWVNNNQLGQNTSQAIFAQGTYDLSSWIDGLSVTAGLRQTWDDREAEIRNHTATTCRFTLDTDNDPTTPEVNPGLAGCSLKLSESFDQLTYNFSLDYKVDDQTLIYAATRRGYRSGGFSARAATEEGLRRPFQPELVDDVELGLKRDWTFGGATARTNIAIFQSNYTDIQRYVTDLTVVPTVSFIVNAAEATIKGLEFEGNIRPNEWFELSGFYSYLDASFDKFEYQGRDLSGLPLARAPKNIASITGTVFLPIPSEAGDARFAVTYYKTASYSSADDYTPLQVIPGYELVNMSLQWNNVYNSNVDLTAFVSNATNEEYVRHYTSVFPSLGYDSLTPGTPRTYGLQFKAHF
ncbi:TonB-dependent receptor [Brevundimonas sp.]|uniref:TonB-dependent receptor n=1 Tax=Brevundimonas sp. TaxID=1871086 RepID=UPI003BA95C1D